MKSELLNVQPAMHLVYMRFVPVWCRKTSIWKPLAVREATDGQNLGTHRVERRSWGESAP